MPSSIFQPVEAISGARKIIAPEHEAIHSGVHFTATHNVTVGTATAVTVLIQTPASSEDKHIHFVCDVQTNKGATWTLSEAPNASGGTTLVALNNDRNSSISNPATLTHTVTYVSSGTILETHISGSAGTPQSKTGGAAEVRNEWILKEGTLYLIRVVAEESDTKVSVGILYYYRS